MPHNVKSCVPQGCGTSYLVEQLALMVMDEYKLSMSKVLELVYNSQLCDKIMELEMGLYYQSAKYNYELLRHEVRYGK